VDDVDHTHDDESLDIEIRPTIDLVRRAAVLAAIAERGVLEVDGDREPYERDTDRFDLLSWVRSALAGAVSPAELRLLETPVGDLGDDLSLCDDALIDAATIAWALGVVAAERLPVPQDGDAEERLLAWAPPPWSDLDRLARGLEPRSEEEIAAERERWEVWFWRAMDADDETGAIAEVVTDLAESGLIPTADGDLATDAAEPFGSLTPDEQEDIAWLAEHRLRTLNWVCGFGDTWESVPLYPD
jgi:hypothetical protein